MKTKCLVVDDEPLAIKVMESHIGKIPSLELIASCNNAIAAMEILLNSHVDIVFLDIEMPEITGLDLIKSLNKSPAIVFTTAYRDFAIDAYEHDAIDYLLKPISFERFFKSISKYYQWKGKDQVEVRGFDQAQEAFIYVRADRKILKIFLADILYIESLKDYVKIHTRHEVIITREKISNLEEKLPEDQFLRTHRSFLVAVNCISSFSSEIIEIKNQEIPIGRTFKSAVLGFLGYHE